MDGIIFDIKRFAVHDGAGIRSTLFLKGCPLRCPWCQNPEGISPEPQLWYAPGECIGCGTCVKKCKNDALSLSDGRIHINRDKCTLNTDCVFVCPAAALKVLGEKISPEEAAKRLLRDKLFFSTHGGVTLSGGEVLMQHEFAIQVLSICKKEGADTAIETCLLAPSEVIDEMIPVTDHFIVDIKILDNSRHRDIVGADNTLILENFKYLVERGVDVLVRTPLIPGFTDSDDNIMDIATFIRDVDSDIKYELLNFNPLCKSKYAAMEMDYPVDSGLLSAERMEHFYKILEDCGIKRIIKE